MRRLSLVLAAVMISTGLAAPPTTAAPAAVPAAALPRSTVTLITGDQVVTAGGGDALRVVGVRPGPGRDRIGHLTATSKGRVLVYPNDAVESVRSGRLDERLFDVAGLVAMGYDDAHRSELPLLLGHPSGVLAEPRGVRVTRQLPEVGLTAVQQPRADATTFWRSLSAGGPERVWLDGRAKISLDQSVPQVGAPRAWENGHTGKGARVAVLDTGYDRNHPDLAGKVVAEKDFTGNAAGVQDGNGHGTHVASTVAGSGARHRGVAPDAELMVGKVCDDYGSCPDSAVLDGMLWAAENGARVVNLSLGGGPSDGSDPLSTTVNELTERHGTLFVVAAGNFGAEETVSTPAVADSALAVASVTKQDTPSGFSSRGPRPGDRAVKPDIAAPGTDIVAARAASTLPDVAVDENYARLSGTSMATPHVSGAAAILAGTHPDWPAGRLKTVLMGTAEPVADAGVYTIGTGRLDVAAADRATVWADRGSLSLDPAGKETLTYHNDGPTPVTLTLNLALTDRYGDPAPDGLLTAEPRTLTVPAGGTASTTITADPSAARSGLFGGRLTATAGRSTVVTTGLGVHVQAEPRTLTVTAKAAKDETSSTVVIAQNEDTGELGLVWTGGEQPTLVELPAGRYRLTGEVTGVVPIIGTDEFLVTSSTLFAERIDVTTTDANLVLDGTRAEPITRGVDDPAARQNAGLTGVDLALPRTGDGQPSRIGVATFNLHGIFLLPSKKKIDGLLLHDSAFWQEPLLSTTVVGTGREFRLRDSDPVDFTGDVTAPLVDVGQGRDEDLEGKPLNGAIVLFTPPAELPSDEVDRRVAALGQAGAALVILGESDWWASPPSTSGAAVEAAYIEVTELRELLAAGPVSLRVRGIDNSARGYFTYHQVNNQLPAGITWTDRRDRMAAVTARLNDPRQGRTTTVPLEAYVIVNGEYLTTSAMEVRPPAKVTLHVTPGVLTDFVAVAGLSPDWYWFGQQYSTPREFRRGERVDMYWHRAPYGPALSTTTIGTEGEPLPLAYRTGDKLNVALPMFTNSPGAGRFSSYDPLTDTGSTTLKRDGEVVGRNDVPGLAGFDVPPGTARYELTVDATRLLLSWPSTTRVTDRWTFTASADGKPLPLLDVEYDLPLDPTNAAPAGEDLTGVLQVTHQVGAHRSRISSVGLEVSYDDGATWRRAETSRDGGKWTVRIPSGPPDQKFASLRTTATDAAGNSVTETLIHAYQLR